MTKPEENKTPASPIYELSPADDQAAKMPLSSPGAISPPALAVSFAPRNWDELKSLSADLASSNLTPTQFRGKPNDVMVAVLMGLELGLNPAIAIQNIAVVEGRPAPFGDIVLALVRRSPDWVEESYQEWFELDGDRIEDPYDLEGNVKDWPNNLRAVCVVQRRGGQIRKEFFSVGRARQAGLWMRESKQGKGMPWSAYPADMLMWRARARAIRPTFADVLKGCAIYEDIQSAQPQEREINPAGNGQDLAPPMRAASRSEEVLQAGKKQKDLLENVSDALAEAKTVQDLKAVVETENWKKLNTQNQKEAQSRYMLRLQEMKDAATEAAPEHD